MRARFVPLGILLVAMVWQGVERPESTGVIPFDHEAHEGLFPLCINCHAGIPTGDPDRWYPEHSDCASCHDGEHADFVDWWRPLPPSGHLRFSHPGHAAALADTTLECLDCHGDGSGEFSFAVSAAPPEGCLECHAHRASRCPPSSA